MLVRAVTRDGARSFIRRSGGLRLFSNFITVGDDAAFEKLTEGGNTKHVYYFTASWCPPCKMIGPIFEKMAPEYPDIQFLKVDVDELPETSATFGIRSVPTFLFAEGGEILGPGVVGADEAGIRRELDKLK